MGGRPTQKRLTAPDPALIILDRPGGSARSDGNSCRRHLNAEPATESGTESAASKVRIPSETSLTGGRCLIWITQVSLHNVPGSDQTLAEKYCEYGVFLSDAKREWAESANQQQRRSQVLAAVYKTALRNNNTKKLNQTQRQHEDNEKAFENTKREA